MDKTQFSFAKAERLCGEKRIDRLFAQGKSYFVYPLRVCWLFTPQSQTSNVQVLLSVPKKKMPKAVDRNRTKRLIKESYRLSKSELIRDVQEKQGELQLAFIWMSHQMPKYAELQLKMQEALNTLRLKLP